MICDNISNAHDSITIAEDANALRTICKICKHQDIIRKDWREVPYNRQYSKVFKRDIMQGNDNLFYKLHPEWLRT